MLRAALVLLVAAAVAACDDDLDPWLDGGDAASTDVDGAADADAPTDSDGGGPLDADAHAAETGDATADLADGDAEPVDAVADTGGPLTECSALFGAPNENTGLDDTACRPECACDDETWVQPVYTAVDVAALRAFNLVEAPAVLDADPYASPPPEPPDAAAVCAVIVEGSGDYRVESFPSEAAALEEGASVTHAGTCGLCSSLADLAVYMETPDLTAPVRECGLQGIREGDARTRECLLELGFTAPCAEIWYYNTLHTRSVCARDCFALIGAPYHNEDGSLNACLQCDEDLSGPVFKAYAGRTRRNTGLATAMCRPCEEVLRVEHRYNEVQ
jgi:hypothetical protein